MLRRLLLLGLLAAATLRADAPGVGTTSANFLKLNSDARAEALGEAYVAVADDVGGLDYNPSGMLGMSRSALQFTHTSWFGSVYTEKLGLVHLISPDEAMGFGFTYVGLPQQDETVADAGAVDGYRQVGTFNPYDVEFSGALAWQAFWGIRAGAMVNITDQNLAGDSAMGVSFDLGFMRDVFIKNLQAGLAVQNVGPPIPLTDEKFGLPMVFRGGLSYTLWRRLLLTTELGLPNDNTFFGALGGEVAINDSFCLRAGYRFDGIFDPFSAGFGFKMQAADLDASWVPMGELGQTFRLSMAVHWGGWLPEGKDIALQGVQTLMLNNSLPQYSEIRLQPLMRHPDDAKDWTLFIYGGSPSRVIWHYTGTGPIHGSLVWGGVSEGGGPVPGGSYQAVLAVRLRTGVVQYSEFVKLTVNPPLPQPTLDIDPESLDPAQPGTAFVATKFKISAPGNASTLPLRWRLDILDASNKAFQRQEGSLQDNPVWIWTGVNPDGKEFASNSDYHFVLSLIDSQGNVLAAAQPLTKHCMFRH